MTDAGSAPRRDPFVDRANEMVTTAFDALATLAMAFGAWVWGERYLGPGASYVVAAWVLLIMSGLAQRRQRPHRVKVPPGAHPHPEPPGPEDPGTLHVRGR